jgi:large repetitive protein
MHTSSANQISISNINLDSFRAKSQKVIAKLLIITLLVLDVPVVPLFGSSNSAQAAALVTPREAWVTVTPRVDSTMQNLNIPANAATQGMWSAPFAWPMNGLHNMILPDGKVLTFGTDAIGNNQDGRLFDIWDPYLGFGASSHNSSYQAAQQDSFCATATYLNDGNMLITGGNAGNGGFGRGSLIYNPVNNTRATAQAVTALPRWYSTMVGLPDGRKLVMGGMVPYTEGMFNDPAGAIARGEPSMTPEILENGAWRSLVGANSRLAFGPDFLRTSFPHAFVAPNGQVFGISADRMWYLDVNANSGAGAVFDNGQFKPGPGFRADPDNVGALSVAVMYDIGKIIQAGGNGGFNGDGYPASNKATSIDINNGAPVLTELPRMNIPRRYGNGIVLANGEVVITGGTRQGNDGGGNAVYAAEIWNPVANNWRLGANASTIRVYHSINSLLLNGAIIVTGGGTPGPVVNRTGEVYYPPYLFEQIGGASRLAARPAIRGISGLKYANGATMQMDMDSTAAIRGLSLIALSNGTHSFNNNQRRIPLQFTQEDNRLTATIPNANLTPPGYYQVVALNAQGVPSYANVIAVGAQMATPQVATTPYDPGAVTPPPPPPPANVPPTVTLTAPATGTAFTQGTTVAITATAADSDGAVAYVDFFDGGTLLGSDTTAPYAFNWATSALTATGSHSITAAAVDNAGARTVSAARSITINAPVGGGGSSTFPTGVAGAWLFNEGTGATVADASGNNRPITLSNATWTTGISGQAAQFNGVNTSGRVGQALLDTSASFSVSAWVKLDNLNGWQTFVNQDGVNVSGFWLQYSQFINGNKFMLTMHDIDSTASAAYRAISTTTPVVGQWYHLVGVRDKATNTMKMYVNGVLEATVPYTGGWASNGAVNVGRGQYGGPNDWVAGAIDGVSIYTRALADSDVTSLYQARGAGGTVTPPTNVIRPTASTSVTYETRVGATGRVWVVNPDNDSVSVLDATTNTLIQSVPVGIAPRTIAIAPNGNIWVTNKDSATISVISPTTLAVVQTIAVPRASQPYGLAFAPNGSSAFVVLEALGQVRKLDPANGALVATLAVGSNPRHVSVTADSATVLVSRFITHALPGEATATVDTSTAGAEVVAVNTGPMTLNKTIVLRHSDIADTELRGSGIPNYLGAAAISPDGRTAWVPSKQDNIKRGIARNGQPLNFQNTVRAISSRIDMSTLTEDLAARIDHDNASLGSAAVYHPTGNYLFVALETSREVAVLNAAGTQLYRINVGRAPQGLAISPDGNTLYVQEFMDRSVAIVDLTRLIAEGAPTSGVPNATVTNVVFTIPLNQEKLPANVVLGKQLFYDARDPRLSLDSYMSCASCHNDGGHDGRVWDLTGFGEGLRNTIALKGRAAMGHGNLHWSANFDELQDFEGQIRTLAGGRGLMTDAQFNTGTRNQPLGDRKAGVSADLDNLAAYVASLNTFSQSPNRNVDGTLTTAATAGRTVFANSCASCHGGANFTTSSDGNNLRNIGTINALSGQRLGVALAGIDVPTLRDAWATAPYLHNGSAATLTAAVQAHNNLSLNVTDLTNVVAFVQQIGSEESALTPPSNPTGDTDGDGIADALDIYPTDATRGAGIWREQYNGIGFGVAVADLTTAAKFPNAPDVVAKMTTFTSPDNIGDAYGSRIRGIFTAPTTGAYTFWVAGDDETRLNLSTDSTATNKRQIAFVPGWSFSNEWTKYPEQRSVTINLVAGQNYYLEVLHKEGGGGDGVAVAWQTPSNPTRTVMTDQFFQRAGGTVTPPANVAPTVALTAPVAGTTITRGTTVAITATAADSDGTVARVEFYDGTTLLGTDTTAPYAFSWVTTTSTATGTRSLTARAFDNRGAATTSAARSVTVNAPTPPASAIFCASENGTCRIPTGRTATVWYGANTSWAVRTGVSVSIGCNNSTFGDPIRGTVKSCRYLAN